LSLSFGDLSLDIELPSELQLNERLEGVRSGLIARGLNLMNYIIMMTMFIVASFYALSCLFNERQDQSVLFWRSLPISDTMTVVSKMIIALVLVPLMVIVCQVIVAFIFFGTGAFDYLSFYFGGSLSLIFKAIVWSLLPTVAWCLFCSEVAKKNPFLLAFIAPILLWVVDRLFLSGVIGKNVMVNRWIGFDSYTSMPLITGLVISVACIGFAIVKRSQRI